MTRSSLSRDIPTLEPDDDLVNRLAELAAASRPTRASGLPAAFGRPATRAIAIAATVTAITAGAAAAATHLGESHHVAPSHPSGPVGIHEPPKAARHSLTPAHRPTPTPTPTQPTAHAVNHPSARTTAPTPPSTNTKPAPVSTPAHTGPRQLDGTDTQGESGHQDGNQSGDGSQDGSQSGDGSQDGSQSGDGNQDGASQSTGSSDTGGSGDNGSGDTGGSGDTSGAADTGGSLGPASTGQAD